MSWAVMSRLFTSKKSHILTRLLSQTLGLHDLELLRHHRSKRWVLASVAEEVRQSNARNFTAQKKGKSLLMTSTWQWRRRGWTSLGTDCHVRMSTRPFSLIGSLTLSWRRHMVGLAPPPPCQHGRYTELHNLLFHIFHSPLGRFSSSTSLQSWTGLAVVLDHPPHHDQVLLLPSPGLQKSQTFLSNDYYCLSVNTTFKAFLFQPTFYNFSSRHLFFVLLF